MFDDLSLPEPIRFAVNPISWLIGKWETISGHIIGDKGIEYNEQIQFSFTGQPLLCFRARSWKPSDNTPMHFESGFLRPKPNTNEISLITAHNFGVTIIEEGIVNGNEIKLKSTKLGRTSFAKPPEVTEIQRTYTFIPEKDELHLNVEMGTVDYKLKPHLQAVYKKTN